MLNSMLLKKITALVMVLSLMTLLTACGGGEQSSVAGGTAATVNSVMAETVKVVKNGDIATITYQTKAPVKDSKVVTSDFSFNEAPLWSEFHNTVSADGVNHTATVKMTAKNMNFMIYNSAGDRCNNGGKGFKLE